MAWSLLNHMIAEKVNALLDEQKDAYPPHVKRFFSREKTAAVIHAALWAHAVREDSTAGAYAFMALTEALDLKNWCFDQEEADALNRFRAEKARAEYAAESAGVTVTVVGDHSQ